MTRSLCPNRRQDRLIDRLKTLQDAYPISQLQADYGASADMPSASIPANESAFSPHLLASPPHPTS